MGRRKRIQLKEENMLSLTSWKIEHEMNGNQLLQLTYHPNIVSRIALSGSTIRL